MSETGAGPGMDFLFQKVPGKSGKDKRDDVKPVENKPVEDKLEQDITETGITETGITEQVEPVIKKPDQGKSVEDISGQVKPGAEIPEQGISDTSKTDEVKPSAEDNVNQDNLVSIKPLKVKIIRESVEAASSRRQRIAVWSPVISATMWYLKATTPMFSISDEARSLIEEGLEKKYPELFKRIKDEMGK